MNTTATRLMTTEEMLALPDDGKERWLCRGQLREKPMTVRNRFHSRLLIRIGRMLDNWNEAQPVPRGAVLGGEVGCRLSYSPDTTVGIDVAYISAEMAANQSDDTTLLEGVPSLVVEILSPNDTQKEIHEKIDVYLGAGVPHVWVVDPHDHAVRIYRPGNRPDTFHPPAELTAEPELPGFRLSLAQLFDA